MNQGKTYTFDKDIRQDLAADGSLAGVEAENPEQLEPFDPEQISIEPKVVPMETLIRRLKQGSIRLAPPFQRKEIWDLERKSQLIESLMLKIPIPMFYVAADENGNWDVVDGLQRLTAIKEFIGKKYIDTGEEDARGQGFPLSHLEFWGEKYDGLVFKRLPPLLINRILETEFRFTIINPGTPEEVKRNIFKRLNTGGMPLTAQEIRHALYQGKSTELLADLVETRDFKKATSESVNDSRMAGRELILRFMAFSIRSYRDYPKNSDMDKFLSDTMRIINIMPEISEEKLARIFKNSSVPNIVCDSVDILRHRFLKGIKRSYKLFSEHTFRKSFDRNRRAPINKALFETWGNLLSELGKEEFQSLVEMKENFMEDYIALLKTQNFVNSISRNSLKHSGIQSRYMVLGGLVAKYSGKKEV